MPDQHRELLDARQAADLLGLTRWQLYQAIRRGELPGAVRLGRRLMFKRRVLEAWLRGELPADPEARSRVR
jgi:excisionase family DNA binding protein